ncbi:Flp family type IVb pilin [Acetobacter suratthaniensis]|uniref:Flp family type IVb pilin n=1 Tax=Acetobacter suratthaniensis TaxID=1502841 RepID=A0ABS3LJL3_9PROT|nr:Flp family type IVb pilin [Acetobacter suratthaniensis]MBO1327803.1 Flp family type IVb pilin [Acetobacter suratthaniensis]MCX2566017.1 Flp family type IVb pilin [Acetobacter suratthaniensis]
MLKIHQAVGSFIYRLRRDKRGVTALEYGLIAALIAVVIISAVTTMGQKLQYTFQHVANSLPSN